MQDQVDDGLITEGCPGCGSKFTGPVKYTWWGGVLGPKLLHHTRCTVCKLLYNSKTRESNSGSIMLYFLVVFVVSFLVFFFLRIIQSK